jgi:hypothetical protein
MQVIDYQEVHEGLYKWHDITLPKDEWASFLGRHTLSDDNAHINFIGFTAIIREQLKLFCQRRLGNFIKSVQEDSGQEAMKMFASKVFKSLSVCVFVSIYLI